MSESEFRTRKGELLNRLEHQCEEPGRWTVEGCIVWRGQKYWRIRVIGGERVSARENGMEVSVWPTFTEALEVIADKVQSSA